MSSGTGYFDQVSAQLEATVGAQMSGVVSGASANAEAGRETTRAALHNCWALTAKRCTTS